MTVKQLELRLTELERQVAELTQSLAKSPPRTNSGWRSMVGAFADDNSLAEAVELGKKVAGFEEFSADSQPDPINCWRKIWGAFADDPDFDEAMKLGRKYREAQRPQAKTPRKQRRARS